MLDYLFSRANEYITFALSLFWSNLTICMLLLSANSVQNYIQKRLSKMDTNCHAVWMKVTA